MSTLAQAGLQALERRRDSLQAACRAKLSGLLRGVTPSPSLDAVDVSVERGRVVFRDQEGTYVTVFERDRQFVLVEPREDGGWTHLGEFTDLEGLGRLLHGRNH